MNFCESWCSVRQDSHLPLARLYSWENEDAYKSDSKFPNSGYVRASVSPTQVKVDCVRSYQPKDEGAGKKNGEVAFSYTMMKDK